MQRDKVGKCCSAVQGMQLSGVCKQGGDTKVYDRIHLDVQNDIKVAQHGVACRDCGILFILEKEKRKKKEKKKSRITRYNI